MAKRPIDPPELPPPVGFHHGWLVEHGPARTLYLAGTCGYNQKGVVTAPGDLVGQLDRALQNLGCILRDAGMGFGDLVQLDFFLTSRDDYALARKEFGRVWRQHCDRHYPGMAMFEVASLFDPQALIEIQGIAAQ